MVGAVYADLPRHGLGNLLFPWARALVYADQHDLEIIEPRWAQMRVGPYRRGDQDKRRYGQLFLPQPLAMRAKRLVRLRTSVLIDEDAATPDIANSVRLFSGMERYFSALENKREVVVHGLTQRVRNKAWLRPPNRGPYLAMHIRLGDFSRSQGPVTGTNAASPIDWYVSAARVVCQRGAELPVVVCSDGTDAELAPLLSIRGVSRTVRNNAIQDLFCLAGSHLIVGSGSSFSAWGAYLGNRPMLLFPGTNHFLTSDPAVLEVPGDSLSEVLSQGW